MIRLEYFGEQDFEQLMDWISDEALLIKWSGNLFKFPLTRESMEWYIKDTNDLATSDALVYKAVDTETGDVCGHISLGGISRKNRSARISRVLVGHTAARGKGICQQMTREVIRIGFEELKLHRISLGVYDNNDPALNCYKKCGFVIEGVTRDTLWFQGRYHSMIEMSMLENEYRELYGG